MRVKKATTIDGHEVKLLDKFNDFSVYKCLYDEERFYFVIQGEVVRIMDIQCGECQGRGFIEDIAFMDIKKEGQDDEN